jgi:hypothetical protein
MLLLQRFSLIAKIFERSALGQLTAAGRRAARRKAAGYRAARYKAARYKAARYKAAG